MLAQSPKGQLMVFFTAYVEGEYVSFDGINWLQETWSLKLEQRRYAYV